MRWKAWVEAQARWPMLNEKRLSDAEPKRIEGTVVHGVG